MRMITSSKHCQYASVDFTEADEASGGKAAGIKQECCTCYTLNMQRFCLKMSLTQVQCKFMTFTEPYIASFMKTMLVLENCLCKLLR